MDLYHSIVRRNPSPNGVLAFNPNNRSALPVLPVPSLSRGAQWKGLS